MICTTHCSFIDIQTWHFLTNNYHFDWQHNLLYLSQFNFLYLLNLSDLKLHNSMYSITHTRLTFLVVWYWWSGIFVFVFRGEGRNAGNLGQSLRSKSLGHEQQLSNLLWYLGSEDVHCVVLLPIRVITRRHRQFEWRGELTGAEGDSVSASLWHNGGREVPPL